MNVNRFRNLDEAFDTSTLYYYCLQSLAVGAEPANDCLEKFKNVVTPDAVISAGLEQSYMIAYRISRLMFTKYHPDLKYSRAYTGRFLSWTLIHELEFIAISSLSLNGWVGYDLGIHRGVIMSSKALKIHTMGKRENPVLLFLHAFPFSANMWNEQMQHFSEQYYCVAPDLPGFGESALPGFPVTFEHYVDAVLNYLKESKIDRAVWCGLSMGGYLALRMIERAPELCRALILCDTKGAPDNNEAKIKRWDGIKALQNNRSEFVAKQWQTLVGETSRKNIQLKTRFEELIAKVSDSGISSGLVALATRTDSMQMLNKIRVSTLIIVGDEDKVTPRADAEALSENIAGAKLKTISHAGHISNLENPASFNKIVVEFLSTIKTK